MNAVTPRPDGRFSLIIAKDQPEYLPLPVTVGPAPETEITTEWEPTAEELAVLMNGGRVRLRLWTFGNSLSPLMLDVVEKP